MGAHDDRRRYGHELFDPEAPPTEGFPPVRPTDLADLHEQLAERAAAAPDRDGTAGHLQHIGDELRHVDAQVAADLADDVDDVDTVAEVEQLHRQYAELLARGVPPGALLVPPFMSPAEVEQLAAAWRAAYGSGIPGAALVLPPGVRFEPLPEARPDGVQVERESHPVHTTDRKVAAATVAGAAAVALGAVATGILSNLQLLDDVAPWVRFLVVAVFVPVASGIAGYYARSSREP